MQVWYSGAFTLLMHNHIHNNGVLQKSYATFDWLFPYILEPLMGHTWDSYYYHHVKAHHVEGNGPDDLSTTIRYQRDSVLAFLHYQMRFLLLCWFDLTRYFLVKGKYKFAFRVLVTELSSYAFMYFLACWTFKPTLFTLILPFVILRFGLMTGNWGQHALVDEVDPNSDFRSSITLIDVPVSPSCSPLFICVNLTLQSNRFCFNDGYHTSHHLNPRRHWREHPNAFLKAKDRYSKEGALVFQNIDYLEITFRILTKNYAHLAKRLVPMGDQIGMSQTELADMLRRKTRKFSEKEIATKFKRC
jgi:fatty acid desaturase